MDLTDLRRLIIISIAADDFLVEKLVLKGGNALELVHQIGHRASLDIDYSIDGDFDDVDEVKNRLWRSIRDRFDTAGYVVFDEKFGPRPPTATEQGAEWGGYRAEFKIISRQRYRELKGNVEDIRRQSVPSGPDQKRTFKIDISKFEYCAGSQEVEVDAYTCFVYTPEMIAVEKLRAICQQMPAYEQRRHPAPRPRDFYDIHAVIKAKAIDVSSPRLVDLVRQMFAAKAVPLNLLGQIRRHREFHRQGWPSVANAVLGVVGEFDDYFEFVCAQADRLQSLWVPEAPL
jgi:Nucleotidyl transferase AbiEii toxin, Type IV TA system